MRTTALRFACLAAALAAPGILAGPMTQPHEVDGVEVTVLEAKRGEGNVLTVKWTLENKTAQRQQLTKERTGWYDAYRVSGDAYFLDAKNRRKHVVLKDNKNIPASSKAGELNKYTFIEPKKKMTLWAKFEAPPADVARIELHLPGASLPFEGVPVTP